MTVRVDWHFFSLVDAEDPLPYDAVLPNRDSFIGSEEAEVRVFTGIAMGQMEIPVITFDTKPPAHEPTGWDEVEEATLQVPSGKLAVKGPMDAGQTYDVPPGELRVRIYAAARDSAWDLVRDFPEERYLIHVWPDESG